MNEIENNITVSAPPSLAARISLMFIGLMAILPFLQVHHARPIPAFYTEYVAFALGLLALTLLLSGRYWRNLALPWIVFAPLGLFAVLLLQLNLKMPAYYETQIIGLFYLMWAILLIILGSVLRKELGLATITTALAWFFLAGGELSATVGMIQHFEIPTFLDDFIAAKNRAAVYGNVGQTNHFANHICLALASLIFLFTAGKLRPWMAAPLALPLLLVLTLSGQRSPWLYLFSVLALALLFLWQGRSTMTGLGRKLVTSTSLLIVGFALMQWLVQIPLFSAPTGIITATDRMFEQAAGTAIRFYLWREAWHMFLQAPLLGVGFGQYAWHHFQLLELFQNPEITGVYSHAHHIVIDLLAETGLAGTLPVVGGITVWLFNLKRQPFDLALWWLLTLFTIIGIHSMLEFPLWYGHYLGPAAFLFGVGETRFQSLRLPRLGRPAMLLLLVLGWGLMITIEQDYRQIESVMPNRTGARKDINGNLSALQELHQKTLLSPYVDFALGSAMELNRENLDLKLTVNQRVMRFNPGGSIVYKQAILLALKGEHEAAIRQAERADSAYPGDLEKFADSLVLLKAENPQALERLMEWANRKLSKKRAARVQSNP